HTFAVTGPDWGECGDPFAPDLSRAAVGILLRQPGLVIARDEGPDCKANLVGIAENPAPHDLLLRVRMNRSATPLVSGSRTKAKLGALPRKAIRFWTWSDEPRLRGPLFSLAQRTAAWASAARHTFRSRPQTASATRAREARMSTGLNRSPSAGRMSMRRAWN